MKISPFVALLLTVAACSSPQERCANSGGQYSCKTVPGQKLTYSQIVDHCAYAASVGSPGGYASRRDDCVHEMKRKTAPQEKCTCSTNRLPRAYTDPRGLIVPARALDKRNPNCRKYHAMLMRCIDEEGLSRTDYADVKSFMSSSFPRKRFQSISSVCGLEGQKYLGRNLERMTNLCSCLSTQPDYFCCHNKPYMYHPKVAAACGQQTAEKGQAQ